MRIKVVYVAHDIVAEALHNNIANVVVEDSGALRVINNSAATIAGYSAKNWVLWYQV